MSVVTRNPMRVAGTVTNSGNVNTGEQMFTLGGGQRATFYSGNPNAGFVSPSAGAMVNVGFDTLIYSGAGRFKSLTIGEPLYTLSGIAINVYDAASPASGGGPLPQSGHAYLGGLPGAYGSSGQVITSTQFVAFDAPFNNGLCVHFGSGALNANLLTVTFTPETNLGFGGLN